MTGLIALMLIFAAAAIGLWFVPPPAACRLARLPQPTSRPVPPLALRRLIAWVAAAKARRSSRARWQSAVIELCDGLTAELTAGRSPEVAFSNAVAVLDAPIAEALIHEWKGHAQSSKQLMPVSDERPNVDDALERLASRPGAEGLRLLAASWRIGAERGGAFATVIEGLSVALRDEATQRQEIAAQLAGPRATARLLAVLPLPGLAMAAALGASPLRFLFGTAPGVACLVVGIALDVLGLRWTGRLASNAEVPR